MYIIDTPIIYYILHIHIIYIFIPKYILFCSYNVTSMLILRVDHLVQDKI